jgi:hypothetical protein
MGKKKAEPLAAWPELNVGPKIADIDACLALSDRWTELCILPNEHAAGYVPGGAKKSEEARFRP